MKRVLAPQHVRENPPGLVGEALLDNGITYKVVYMGEEALPDPAGYDAQKLVVIDECGSHISLTPLYARAPEGSRLWHCPPQSRQKYHLDCFP